MEFNLKKTNTAAPPPMEDITFALHALAVIEVHSSQSSGGQKMTIRKIAQHDSYLSLREHYLLFEFMCSFGQHAVPVFERYLSSYGKPVEYADIVAEIRRRLKQ